MMSKPERLLNVALREIPVPLGIHKAVQEERHELPRGGLAGRHTFCPAYFYLILSLWK